MSLCDLCRQNVHREVAERRRGGVVGCGSGVVLAEILMYGKGNVECVLPEV